MADMILFNGNFGTSGFDGGFAPTSGFAGSWSFEFDTSQVSGTGIEYFGNADVSNFNFTPIVIDPPGGATTFSSANNNVALELIFLNGAVAGFRLGGDLSAPPDRNEAGQVESGQNDFRISYNTDFGQVNGILVSNLGGGGTASGMNLRGRFHPVPEPSSAALLGLVAGLAFFRRSRHPSGALVRF